MDPASRPNLILITTNQHRGDCLGCEGHPVLQTPYLDELAEDGARFSRAYSAVPSSLPARMAILTGMDQWNHGRLASGGDDPLLFPATLPGELARSGYQTQAVGKMYFVPERCQYGFHHMLLDEGGRRLSPGFKSDYDRWLETMRREPVGPDDHGLDWNSWVARPSHLPEHLHPTAWATGEAIWFLRQRDTTRPFFLWLSFSRPHPPLDPPAYYFDLYARSPYIPKPVTGEWSVEFNRTVANVNAPFSHRSERDIHLARAAYYGNITFIDHQIGRVLTELLRNHRETWDNTLVLFASDHGEMLGDHHHWRKTYAYEPSVRVPCLMRYPTHWKLPRNQVIQQPVELRDIMPTLLDAAEIPVPKSVDGMSLLALADGKTAGWRDWVMGEHTYSYGWDWNYGMQYITDGREKYVWFHAADRERFFHLDKDPGERNDLSKDPDSQERIAVWRQRLAEANELRGDPRGKEGRLVSQGNEATSLSPNYYKWKRRAIRHQGDLG
jgi:arylsulfatase